MIGMPSGFDGYGGFNRDGRRMDAPRLPQRSRSDAASLRSCTAQGMGACITANPGMPLCLPLGIHPNFQTLVTNIMRQLLAAVPRGADQ